MASQRLTYNKLGQFAEGGMASLTAIVLNDGTRALLRELHTAKIFNFSRHRDFRFGVKVRAALSPHPNIVNSLELGYHGLRPYEIIERVDGQNLKALMNAHSDLLQREMLYVITEAAEALAWVHQNGFMHLDVKPENFLLHDTGSRPVVKLTDFDLAKNVNDNKPHSQPGTPAYMAPEQILSKTAYPASDVFAFSLMMYQLVTGRSPFVGDTLKKMRRHQANLDMAAHTPQEVDPSLNPALCTIILKGLEKRREKRYPDMLALVADLKKKVTFIRS